MLKLADKWVWDFWLAQDGPDYHIFYLQAPRELGDENLRHWHAVIGHAVSLDLTKWQVLPDVFCPSENATWDDYLTWTGSIIKSEGIWYFFYTGGCRSEKGRIQRIGLATSMDLMTWERCPGNPLIVSDPGWYETLDLSVWHEEAWRDPWVFQHPKTGDWHAFITARLIMRRLMDVGVSRMPAQATYTTGKFCLLSRHRGISVTWKCRSW